MTREENAELIRRAQNGEKEALDLLVSSNMGLCKSVAARFRDRGTEYEDLVQLAAIGMIKAVRSFDFSFGTAFSTYAVPLIVGEIRRFLRDDGAIKVSRNAKRVGNDAMKKREEFIRLHGREPKLGELAKLCSVSTDELTYSLEAISPVKSLNDPVGNEDDGAQMGDMLSDPCDEIGKLTDRISLAEAIKKLAPDERQLIFLRYYKELSQAQTGKILGMTQVKVSRREKKIIEELKKVL